MVCEGVGYEVSWSQYGSCQLCIWSYEVLNVDIKNFVKELLRKRTLIIVKAIPWIPEPALLSLSVNISDKSCWVLLYSGFVDPLLQVSLMSRSVLDRAAWQLYLVMTLRSNCVALGQGSLMVCFVLYYNAPPLLWFVLILNLVVWFETNGL